MAEIRLNPDHKVSVCHELNKLVKQLKGQVILAVLDDEQDRYVRLIGKGLNANETERGRLWQNPTLRKKPLTGLFLFDG